MFPRWRRWRCRASLRPHRWGFDPHPPRPRHQIELELDQFRRAVIVGLRANAADAAAQAALQRAERLPLQTVERIAGRVSLRDGGARKALVPVVVMAIGAAEIKLALALHEQIASFGDKWLELRVGAGLDGEPARLLRDEGDERQKLAALVG